MRGDAVESRHFEEVDCSGGCGNKVKRMSGVKTPKCFNCRMDIRRKRALEHKHPSMEPKSFEEWAKTSMKHHHAL